MKSGRPFIRGAVTVRDLLDLRSLATVRQPFKCRNCTFEKGIDASDLVFTRTFDLSGSHVLGPANFGGATFQGPALFAAAPGPAEFAGPTDFSVAVFDDLATFDSASFTDDATFQLARFRSDASFESTRFKAHSSFRRATFETAEFRATKFRDLPLFVNSSFDGVGDFSQAVFKTGADFENVQFPAGARFVGTRFVGRSFDEAAMFDGVGAGGTVDFSFASFEMSRPPPKPPPGPKPPPPVFATFSSLLSAGTVSFAGATFPDGFYAQMDQINAKSFVLPVDQTSFVAEGKDDHRHTNRRHVLGLIESSAKARDDLATANDAAYELHMLAERTYPRPYRVLDFVFYRWIAGYFVRPKRPLVALVVLALAVAVARLFSSRSEPKPPQARRRRIRGRRPGRFLARLANEFLDALSRVLPRRSGNDSDEAQLGRRLETLAYRALLACALIGFANSNPTLRQFVDAVL